MMNNIPKTFLPNQIEPTTFLIIQIEFIYKCFKGNKNKTWSQELSIKHTYLHDQHLD